MDIRTALRLGIAQLRAGRVRSDSLAAELLLLHVTGRTRTTLYSHPEDLLEESQSRAYFGLIERRVEGVPTQHLTGKQEFWGMELEVTPDVLIPRPETEHVLEVALDRLALRALRAGQPRRTLGEGLLAADVGTGSGCIALALAKELPAATVYALDVSAPALAVARRNAARFGLSERVRFFESDLFEGLSAERGSGGFDLIVSNPPYVGRREADSLPREVREHEPEIALYGGDQGYEFYGALILQSLAHLKPGGLLVVELGHDSLDAVQPLLAGDRWTNLGVSNDLSGIPRVIAAERT
jgi:release factor glutamine methyltransferase